jgi:glycosyltransferase involved in cell wall biosynthesis
MILSEHSLYVRDVLAQLEGRDNGWTPMPGSNEMPPMPLCRPPADCSPANRFTELRSVITTTAREVYDCADTVTYLDRDLLEGAIAFGLDPARATIVPNAIDVDSFRTVKRKMNPEHAWHIAIIGRIVPVKGIMEGIECAGLLRHLGLDYRMSIIGPDDEVPCYAAACRRKVSDLGLEDVVHFTRTIRAPEALRDVDLLLLPSHKEAMPMVVLEAMAAGVPVVATDTGNVARILGNDGKDETGVVTDLATMAPSLMNLLADERRYQSMRENGPRRAARDFELKTRANDWRQIYST